MIKLSEILKELKARSTGLTAILYLIAKDGKRTVECKQLSESKLINLIKHYSFEPGRAEEIVDVIVSNEEPPQRLSVIRYELEVPMYHIIGSRNIYAFNKPISCSMGKELVRDYSTFIEKD